MTYSPFRSIVAEAISGPPLSLSAAVSLATLLFLRDGYRRPSPGPTFYVQAEPEIVEFDLCIEGERRHIEIPKVTVDPSAGEEGASRVTYLVELHPRTGVITVRYDEQVVYQGQPDSKLAALFDEPMFVTAGRLRSR